MSDQSFAELAAQHNSYVEQNWSPLDTLHHRPPPVPEPATALMLLAGLVAVYLMRRKVTE